MPAKDAFEALNSMRAETYKGVGPWRIEIAESSFVPFSRKRLPITKPNKNKAEAKIEEETKVEEESKNKKIIQDYQSDTKLVEN